LFQGPNVVIHHPDSVLNSMNEWCIQHHGQVGAVVFILMSFILLLDSKNKI